MEIYTLFFGLRFAVILLELMSAVNLGGSVNGLKQKTESTDELSGAGVSNEASSMKCMLQGTARIPAKSEDGDFVIGGVFAIHHKLYTVIYNYTTKPEPPRCTGR